MNWRVINSGIATAATNMAIDEAILLAHGAAKVPPTLRFYGWKPAAVSIGYFQKAAAEIDLTACQQRGIDVVRRLTGGRAVLHDAELTYSIVVREDYPSIPSTITASYRYLSGGLMAGLRQMGVPVQMSIPLGAYGQRNKQHSSAACFDAPSHYEITYEGRKLVGSAQVRKNGVILQHGSVLIRFSAEMMAGILRVSSPDIRMRLAEMLSCRAVSLEDILGCKVDSEEMCSILIPSFQSALGILLEEQALTGQEEKVSKELAENKYSQAFWNSMR